MRKLSYLSSPNRTENEQKLILASMFYALLGAFLVNSGVAATKNLIKRLNNKNKSEICSTIIISNESKTVVYDVKNDEYSDVKYKIEELDEKNWIIYVFGSDNDKYADFISYTVSFDKDGNIILDTDELNSKNYEEYLDKQKVRVKNKITITPYM